MRKTEQQKGDFIFLLFAIMLLVLSFSFLYPCQPSLQKPPKSSHITSSLPPIFQAMAAHDLPQIRKLLVENPRCIEERLVRDFHGDVHNPRILCSLTPLLWAADEEDQEMMVLLVEQGANVLARNQTGAAALSLLKTPPIVKSFLEAIKKRNERYALNRALIHILASDRCFYFSRVPHDVTNSICAYLSETSICEVINAQDDTGENAIERAKHLAFTLRDNDYAETQQLLEEEYRFYCEKKSKEV